MFKFLKKKWVMFFLIPILIILLLFLSAPAINNFLDQTINAEDVITLLDKNISLQEKIKNNFESNFFISVPLSLFIGFFLLPRFAVTGKLTRNLMKQKKLTTKDLLANYKNLNKKMTGEENPLLELPQKTRSLYFLLTMEGKLFSSLLWFILDNLMGLLPNLFSLMG